MHRRSQAGHALAETLVVAAVMVPLFLLLPLIGKYQDLRHAVMMASRSVAFDSALHHDGSSGWTDPNQLADEIRARHFAGGDGLVRTGQMPPEGPGWSRPLWTDPRGRPLLVEPDSIRIGYGPGGASDAPAGFTPVGDGRLFNLNPAASAGRMGLASRGVLTGHVAVPIARLEAGVGAWEPFDRLDLTFTARTSLLVDNWAARSPLEVEQRIAPVSPGTGAMAQAASGLAGFGVRALELGRLPAPRIGDLEMWRDFVPADRLREGGRP